MKRTYQASKVRRARTHGFLVRMANVEAMTPCVVWALRGPRLEELAQRQPALVLELLRTAGGVMAMRMRANLAKQTPFS